MAQGTGAVEPAVGQKWPAVHDVQAVREVVFANVPGVHGSGADMPGREHEWPAGHAVQMAPLEVELDSLEKVPAAHGVGLTIAALGQ